jgi:hypothetical protein
MREFIPGEIRKFIPMIAIGLGAFYAMSAAIMMQKTLPALTSETTDAPKPSPRGQPSAAAMRAAEPVHKSLVRCMNDMDDILDTIHDDRSFAAAKPKLLQRAYEQAAQARLHPDAGMTQVGQLAQYEIREASKRHMKSLTRANEAVPALNKFFNDEVGAALSR